MKSTPARRLRSWLPLALLAGAATPSACAFNSHGDQPDGSGGTAGGTTTTTTSSATTCTPGNTEPCYTGASGTEGVGPCHGGTHTCNEDGRTWSLCVGEVVPKPEICSTPIDENCNGLIFDDTSAGCKCAPDSIATCSTGKPGVCDAGTRKCDADGKGYGACEDVVAPSFDDCETDLDEDCDGAALMCTGGSDEGVAIAGTADDVAYAVAADADGGFVVGGVVDAGTLAAGTFVVTGKMLVARYDKNGMAVWERRFDSGHAAVARGVALDATGNVFVVGEYTGTLAVGNSVESSSGGLDQDMFLAKLDKDGNPLWIKSYGNNGLQTAYGVAVDNNGHVYMTGTYKGDVDFGGGGTCKPPGASGASADMFVAKLDNDGACIWADKTGDGSDQGAASVAVLPGGDAVVTGTFEGKLDFGGPALTINAAGLHDAYVVRYGGMTGKALWVEKFGDALDQVGQSVATDAEGNVVLAGHFKGTIDFGTGPLMNSDASNINSDVFVAKLDGNGMGLWARSFGDSADQRATAVAADGAGHVTVFGWYHGAMDFGGGPFQNLDTIDPDLFVAKLRGPDGAHLWSEAYGDGEEQRGFAVAVDGKGQAVIAGGFKGSLDFGAPLGAYTSQGALDLFAVKLLP